MERFFPHDIANGVARLTVNNLSNLLRALNNEGTYLLEASDKRPECNFRSLGVTDTTRIQGDQNGKGSVTRSFSECEFDFGRHGHKVEIDTLCGPQSATFFGKVRLSGTRTITGIVTKNSKVPVIPSGPEGIVFSFTQVDFSNYRVETSTIDKAMTMISGSASFDATVHLGQSIKNGLCEIPLPNLTLSKIRFSPSDSAAETIVLAPGPFRDFQVAIDGSDLNAQVGIYQDLSNGLSGTLKVFGKTYSVPDDDAGLIPGFDAQTYEDSISCTPNLRRPVQEACRYESDLALAVSRLTIKNLGHLVKAIADASAAHERQECNLGKLDSTPSRTTKLSDKRTELSWVFKDCDYYFSASGEGTTLTGKVRLSGTRRIKGFHLEGNRNNPIIPDSDGVRFEFSRVDFENFTVVSNDSQFALRMANASIAFDAAIHLARGKDTNVCSVALPNITLSNVKYLSRSDLVISTEFGDVHLAVDDSLIHAQVYRNAGRENHIEGSMNLLGNWVRLPREDATLDPGYDSDAYDLTLRALTNLVSPVDEDCNLIDHVENKVADGIARLSINSLGQMLRAITKDTHLRDECRLGSLALTPKTTIDSNKSRVTWRFDDCAYDLDGTVRVSGTKTITGFLTNDERSVVVPATGSSVDFHFDQVGFDNYLARFTDDTYMTLESGTATFDVAVHLAKSASTGLCMIPIPNLTFSKVRFEEARAILVAQSVGISNLQVDIHNSNFDAQFGYGTTPQNDNALSGTIDIYGRRISIPTDSLGLNPFENHREAFEQELRTIQDTDAASRDTLYQCTDFEQVRALNIARLLVLNMGSVTSEAHDEYLKGEFRKSNAWLPNRWPNCGFSSNKVRARGKRVAGQDGTLGEVLFKVFGCEVVNQETKGAYPSDCTGIKTVFEGRATVTGWQSVQGRLQTYAYLFDDIVPNSPQATTFHFDEVSFVDFASYYVSDEEDEPKAKLILNKGSLSAQVKPILAPKKGAPCEFFRATPVVGFDLHVSKSLHAQLHLRLKGFEYSTPLVISAGHLLAQNGIYQGSGNTLSGNLTVNGKAFHFNHEKLNPDYEQTNFDLSYECRERFPKENDFSIEYVIPYWAGWKPDCR